LVIVLVALVCASELDHSLRCDATNGSAANRSGPGERIKWVGNAEEENARIVELVGMDVDEMALRIAEDEIVRMRIFPKSIGVATVFKDFSQQGNVAVLHGNVKIFMRSRLPTKKCIDSPASIDDDINFSVLNQIKERQNIVKSHLRRSGGCGETRAFVHRQSL
jgi:hypothetical protein